MHDEAHYTASKWGNRMLDLARLVATWSKDPSTKVGAVIADDGNRVVSVGFNGPPRGVTDDPDIPRERKLLRTIHAEENALLFATGPVRGCTIYITAPPCAPCAAKLVQAGVAAVVYLAADDAFSARWADHKTEVEDMFAHARIPHIEVTRE